MAANKHVTPLPELVLDGDQGTTVTLTYEDYGDGEWLVGISACDELDHGTAVLPLSDARQVRDWLTRVLASDDNA
jgi:hypothetical protein